MLSHACLLLSLSVCILSTPSFQETVYRCRFLQESVDPKYSPHICRIVSLRMLVYYYYLNFPVVLGLTSLQNDMVVVMILPITDQCLFIILSTNYPILPNESMARAAWKVYYSGERGIVYSLWVRFVVFILFVFRVVSCLDFRLVVVMSILLIYL